MLNNVLEFLQASPAFREAFDAQSNGISALYDMAEGQRPFYAALLQRASSRPVVYIAPSDALAMRAADDCGAWLGGGAAVLPAPDINFTRGTASRDRLCMGSLHSSGAGLRRASGRCNGQAVLCTYLQD